MTFSDEWVDEVRRGLRAYMVFCWFPLYCKSPSPRHPSTTSQTNPLRARHPPTTLQPRLPSRHPPPLRYPKRRSRKPQPPLLHPPRPPLRPHHLPAPLTHGPPLPAHPAHLHRLPLLLSRHVHQRANPAPHLYRVPMRLALQHLPRLAWPQTTERLGPDAGLFPLF